MCTLENWLAGEVELSTEDLVDFCKSWKVSKQGWTIRRCHREAVALMESSSR